MINVSFPVDPQSKAALRLLDDKKCFEELKNGELSECVPLSASPEKKTLRNTLDRYHHGEIEGQSFLIAGHRGAGKTTLVWQALLEAQIDASADGEKSRYRNGPYRIFPIKLDGPSLLDVALLTEDGLDGSAKTAAEEKTASDNQPKEEREVADLMSMIKYVMQATYGDLVSAFAERIRLKAKNDGKWDMRHDRPEMAAHFELLLDTAPLPDTLRDFWRRFDLLKSGVLFPRHQPPPGDHETRSREQETRFDQGSRELLALATATIAYQKVIGKLENIVKSGDETARERSRSADAAGSGEMAGAAARTKAVPSNLATTAIAPLVGIVTGGLSGAVIYSQNDAITAVVGAVIVMLASALGLRLIQSRQDKRHRHTSSVLDIDTRSITLIRDLPRLIQRMKQAGLLPVFVVDELDKVRNLQNKMHSLVTHLKNIVTEEAVFVFLVDRSYYDHIQGIQRRRSYPPERTYFSKRLFVAYRPADLIRHLLDIIQLGDDAERMERDARWALVYASLEQARFHLFDLRGYLQGLINEDGALSTAPDELLAQQDLRVRLLMQLAVLKALQIEEIQDRLKYDPYFVQQVYDAAYYPARMWRDGTNLLDIGSTAFRSYMEQRTLEPPQDNGEQLADLATPPPHDPRPDAELELTHTDFNLLLTTMRTVVNYLKDPASLLDGLRQLDGPELDAFAIAEHLTRGERRREDGIGNGVPQYRRVLVVPTVVRRIAFPRRSSPNQNRFLVDPYDERDKIAATEPQMEAQASLLAEWDDFIADDLKGSEPNHLLVWTKTEHGGAMRGDVSERAINLLRIGDARASIEDRTHMALSRVSAVGDLFTALGIESNAGR